MENAELWKLPPIEKIPEAYGAIADGRVTMKDSAADVVSSDGTKTYHVRWNGNLYSSDTFYDAAGRNARFGKMGILAVEMEAAGLYCTAAYAGKRALAICSISDNLVTGEELSADERQTTFTNMMKIALEVAVKMENKE